MRHYYISSRKLTAEKLLNIARKEWVVETNALVIRCPL